MPLGAAPLALEPELPHQTVKVGGLQAEHTRGARPHRSATRLDRHRRGCCGRGRPNLGYNFRMPSTGSLAEAFHTTLELFEAGVALMRQNLRRSAPDATEDEIDRRLVLWLRHRPGAERGDSPGRSVDVEDGRE